MTSSPLEFSSAESLAEELAELNWTDVSSEVFRVLRNHYSLDCATWEFSIDSPDPNPAELRSPAGSAAFMLRRIQALRFQIRNLSSAPADLMCSHAVELRQFLVNLVISGEFTSDDAHRKLARNAIGRCVESLDQIVYACAAS